MIPTQLGKHYWGEWSSVFGVRIDYLSIIIYLTDIVWVLWTINQLRITRQKLKHLDGRANYQLRIKKLFTFRNIVLLLMMGVNVIFAQNKVVAVYRWLRIGQWWLTWRLVSKNKKKIIKYLFWIIPGWIILESFLGLAQVINAGSLNGIWWWLGERRFTLGGIGIAQMRWLDEGMIRAYGTFSHPNSMAGFLLLAWWWWKTNLPPTPFFNKTGAKNIFFGNIFKWIVNWSAVLGIILAGSRTVWVMTIVLLIAEQLRITNYNNKITNYELRITNYGSMLKKKEILGKFLLGVGIVMLILGVININYRISDFLGGWDSEGWQKREWLGLSSLKMIRSNPLFGVGAGNFLVRLMEYRVGNFYWLQPVHNIFLLAWSEIGIIGLLAIGGIALGKVMKINFKKYSWLLFIVIVTGMGDHYWLTLPQNSWLLAIIFGLL